MKVLIQYLTETTAYNVVSELAKKKEPAAPKPVDIPYSSDSLIEDEGEQE